MPDESVLWKEVYGEMVAAWQDSVGRLAVRTGTLSEGDVRGDAPGTEK